MHSIKKLWLFIALALGCAIGTAGAQEYLDPNETYDPQTPQWRGQAGLTYLQIGGSARAEGMGGAFSAVKGDPSAIFYNPAGMAALRGLNVYFNRTEWIADMSVNHFAVATNTGMFTLGVSYVSMDYGSIIGTVIDEDADLDYKKTGTLNPTAWALGTFVGMELTDRFSTGFQIKYAVQDFGANSVYSFNRTLYKKDDQGNYNKTNIYIETANDNRVGAWVLDLGTQYNTGLRNITINMALQNFAATQRFVDDKFDLPLSYRVGFAADALEVITGVENPTTKVMLYLDGIDQRDVPLDAAFGVEYMGDFSSITQGLKVALRAGRRGSRNQDGWLSAGGGVTIPLTGYLMTVDYSYNDYGPGLTANRIGVSLSM